MKKIESVYKKYGIKKGDVFHYGDYKAKLKLESLFKKEKENIKNKRAGTLILVTAVSPTASGEGKTTVSIGLTQSLNKYKAKAIAALREPSIGPVFGMKGGATGGGASQLLPSDDINLHFNGDMHAITSANNLLAAAIDNHVYFGNELGVDKVYFKRCIDMNDRSLRDGFDITAASEVMAILCLAKDLKDLRLRLSNIIVAKSNNGEYIYAKDLKVVGSMMVLLRDAMMPNIVQTTDGSMVVVHGGPFANIAHGCNSVLATRAALAYGDICVTEAGFGSDLGAEKFFDIKLRSLNTKNKNKTWPRFVIIVATLKSIKAQGEGYDNLKRHIENMKSFGIEVIVAVNSFKDDKIKDLDDVVQFCKDINTKAFITDFYNKGRDGGEEMAKYILKNIKLNKFKTKEEYLYKLTDSIENKIDSVAKKIYKAKNVEYSQTAKEIIKELQNSKYKDLPICIAKTQYSFTDDQKVLGAPTGHIVHVTGTKLFAGAGMIAILIGNIFTMPGLSRIPAAEKIDLDKNGNIINLR